MTRYRWPVALCCCCCCFLALRAGAAVVTFDARALIERSLTRDVRLSADAASLELDRGELIEDDGPAAGYSYKPNEEKLSPGVRVKKGLVIGDPRAARTTLLVAPGGTLEAEVNGAATPLARRDPRAGKWQAYDLPVDALRPGRNEIVLHGKGALWIARDDEYAAGSRQRTKHPNRSARSVDGGQTWDYDRLGHGGTVDGEYSVRLFLERHRTKGSLSLPVIDLSNLEDRPVADPVAMIGPARITVYADAGPAGRITARVRFGPTPVPGPAWGRWHELGATGGTVDGPEGRYAEVAVEFATTDPRTTPRLTAVTVEASPAASSKWARDVRLTGAHNPPIVRSSIPFEYEPLDHPRLRALRQRHRLDAVVEGAADEFELIVSLAQWSAKQWAKGHLGEAYPAWDALDILKPHADGTPVGGFCQHYNVVFLQACESFGLVGRAVSIGPGGLGDKPRRGGHEVVEIWSNDHRKWVFVDGQFAWYAIDVESRTPLSLLELRRRQLDAFAGRPVPPTRIVKPGDVPARAREDWNGVDQGLPFGELRMIPRSNFLAEAAPLPLNQGMRGWSWTGHHVWTDDELPASPIYGHRVATRANWEWSVNEVRVVLEATPRPGEVLVHLETHTPGFAAFLADVDGTGEHKVETGFVWKLRGGVNRLETWSTNVAGRKGARSWIVLEYRTREVTR